MIERTFEQWLEQQQIDLSRASESDVERSRQVFLNSNTRWIAARREIEWSSRWYVRAWRRLCEAYDTLVHGHE